MNCYTSDDNHVFFFGERLSVLQIFLFSHDSAEVASKSIENLTAAKTFEFGMLRWTPFPQLLSESGINLRKIRHSWGFFWYIPYTYVL